MIRYFIITFAIALLLSCNRENSEERVEQQIPKGFPEMMIPEDNAITKTRLALGSSLFFDPILSRRDPRGWVELIYRQQHQLRFVPSSGIGFCGFSFRQSWC